MVLLTVLATILLAPGGALAGVESSTEERATEDRNGALAPAPSSPGATTSATSEVINVVHERIVIDALGTVLVTVHDAATNRVVGHTLEGPGATRDRDTDRPTHPAPTDDPTPSPAADDFPVANTNLPDAHYDGNGDGFVDYAAPGGGCARTDVQTARYYDTAVDDPSCTG